jgi:hypothetical protein
MAGTKNKMGDLRNHLFATLEALQDETNPMEIQRARAIADVAKQVIDSAKVEVDYLKMMGTEASSKFLEVGSGKTE